MEFIYWMERQLVTWTSAIPPSRSATDPHKELSIIQNKQNW